MPAASNSEITTLDRTLFDYSNPDFTNLSVNGLAGALSKLCRYTGHCSKFYSVAEHSVIVSRTVPEEIAIYGLVHDLHESLVGDVNSPLKSLLPEYKAIERDVEEAMYSWLGLTRTPEIIAEVKKADRLAYIAERELLMPPLAKDHPELNDMPRPAKNSPEWIEMRRVQNQICGWGWQTAHTIFMERFKELSPVGTVRQNRMERNT